LFLGACGAPFAGDWQGSGADSMGNEFNFAAKVVDQGDDQYRVLILDAGVLEKNEYIYTADDGIYTGAGTLDSDTFEGYYKGPVDGTYVMQRVDGND
jgi:hypothetical protein